MPTPEKIDPRWKRKPLSKEDAKKIMENPYEEHTGGFLGMPSRQRDYSEEINNLTERVESLEGLIKSIFDGHVLINGQFRKITP